MAPAISLLFWFELGFDKLFKVADGVADVWMLEDPVGVTSGES